MGVMIAFVQYLTAIQKEHGAGDATKHTHRPALKVLLESLGQNVTATNEPRRILCGSPDFQIVRRGVPIGHVETKDVGTNLDEMERGKGPHGEQFTRYRDGLPNWVLTDYLEFRWFVGGEKRLTSRLAELDPKGKLKSAARRPREDLAIARRSNRATRLNRDYGQGACPANGGHDANDPRSHRRDVRARATARLAAQLAGELSAKR